MSEIGFEFHSSTKWKAARAAFASLFVFAAISAMVIADEKPPEQLLSEKPAWFFADVLFLIFSLVLIAQLVRILQTKLVLEFSESAIIDRRLRRPRLIPYSLVEIFSPRPEEIFNVEPSLAEACAKLEVEEYISLSARLRPGREADPTDVTEDFVFFEKVSTPSFEMQEQIVSRLRAKIANFDNLVQDDGTGLGDDAGSDFNDETTNA